MFKKQTGVTRVKRVLSVFRTTLKELRLGIKEIQAERDHNCVIISSLSATNKTLLDEIMRAEAVCKNLLMETK